MAIISHVVIFHARDAYANSYANGTTYYTLVRLSGRAGEFSIVLLGEHQCICFVRQQNRVKGRVQIFVCAHIIAGFLTYNDAHFSSLTLI